MRITAEQTIPFYRKETGVMIGDANYHRSSRHRHRNLKHMSGFVCDSVVLLVTRNNLLVHSQSALTVGYCDRPVALSSSQPRHCCRPVRRVLPSNPHTYGGIGFRKLISSEARGAYPLLLNPCKHCTSETCAYGSIVIPSNSFPKHCNIQKPVYTKYDAILISSNSFQKAGVPS